MFDSTSIRSMPGWNNEKYLPWMKSGMEIVVGGREDEWSSDFHHTTYNYNDC
ncbi:MAG: hypothetical protein WCQ65_12550 [Fermentimonas sp.]